LEESKPNNDQSTLRYILYSFAAVVVVSIALIAWPPSPSATGLSQGMLDQSAAKSVYGDLEQMALGEKLSFDDESPILDT